MIKAEVVRLADREPRDNPRFVVTNLRQTPRFIYEKIYCARGDIENRIKELLDGLQIDRTSCCKFWANQLRVFLTAAAYVLMQELRLRAARTAYARTQVTWLRDRLLKLGVDVRRSVRRLVLHLPRATPYLDAWHHIALALGARAGWPVLLPSAATSHSRADARPSRRRCRCRTLRARRHPATAAQPRRNLPRHSPQAARVRRSDPTRDRFDSLSRVEERRVAGRGRWLIRRFRNRAAGRVPWVRFLPPLSEPGGPISGTGLSSGIMRLAHGLPGHDQRTGLASPGTRLAPLSRPASASSGLLTPWRRRPLGSSPSLVHVMTSGIPAHLRGDRPFGHSREPAPFRHRFHLRSLPSAGITRLPRYLRTSPPP